MKLSLYLLHGVQDQQLGAEQDPFPVERTGRGSLLNHSSRPPDDSIGQGTELN